MRILIVGAGALGGLVGAYLSRAGEDVTLLEVNQARAKLLADAGLHITRVGADETTIPIHVVTSLDGVAPFDLVFIATKTYQTADAVRAALPASNAGTLFFSLQNGIGNAETMADLVGAERVLCGVTYHSIEHAGPGRLRYRAGIKPIQISAVRGGATPAVEAIGEAFRRAGFETNVVANVDHALWQKLLHNAVVNPTSAITGLTCRELLADADLMAFMRDLSAEIIAVMRARGVPIVNEEDPFVPIIGSLKALGKNRPSMWQDLARGTRTEIDALNGAIVREAERLGLLVPHNAALVRFIHSRERQKFLRKQEIVRELGLERARAAGEEAPRPRMRGRPAATRAPRDADAGMPPGGPPLESTRRLKELMHAYYVDLAAASDDAGRQVAACSGLAPVEIVRALGIVPYFPENHAARIAADRRAGPYIARAATDGFSQFSSSAMRTDVGALLAGSTPLTDAHGIAGPPRPDVVTYSTNTGHDNVRWFEFYGTHYGVPVMGVHPPPAGNVLEQIDVDAAVHQLLRLQRRLEERTGRTLDMDRLGEVVDYSAQAATLWDDILCLARATPAPITFFDTLIHVAPMILLRGTSEAVDYYTQLKAEVEDRVAQGVSAVPNEAHRLYWDGPPIWCALRPLARMFEEAGAAIVASTFCSEFALRGLEPYDPLESMARAYTGIFDNRSEDWRAAYLAQQFEQFGVDAAIYHDCRTTPETSHVRYGPSAHQQLLNAVPGLVIEADSHDLRLFSTERLQEQFADFLEQRVERAGVR
ncbi:MAG: 2-dehydropantoate 2-reductase [Gemmatimonadetes bacterium]|nr:2-dehydropantoate 2-reductase [Gemmatimonadota bacterium]